jgi:ABC-type Co2+ transport system permease subunit
MTRRSETLLALAGAALILALAYAVPWGSSSRASGTTTAPNATV